MGERLRCFVAVNLPGELRETIGEYFAALRKDVRGVKWVAAANLHLTLKFLGSVEPEKAKRVGEALDGALAGTRPVGVTLSGAGAFPPRGRPRVVWLDLAAGGSEMTALQAAVEGALAPLGFAPEGRRFTPHLTVGRVKSLKNAAALFAALDSVRDREWGRFTASAVHLMRSELFPTGARYSILHEVRLTGD
jgi:2'-5' RNA ligase